MILTRRTILLGAAALGALGRRAWSATSADFGDFSVQTLSDGHLVLPDAAGAAAEIPLNVTLLTHGDALVLFDAGSGPDFVPTAGRLVEALEAAGTAPDDVTHVLFTHAHPDHFWGILDEFDEPLFANARLLMGRAERDWWADPATLKAMPPDRESFFAGAARRIEALGDRLETFEDGAEVMPGVTARMTAGHTRGHTAFEVGGRLVVIGDAVTSTASFADPTLPAANDHFPDEAIATRVALLADLASSGRTLVGYHLPEGGIGHAAADGNGYAFVPEIKS